MDEQTTTWRILRYLMIWLLKIKYLRNKNHDEKIIQEPHQATKKIGVPPKLDKMKIKLTAYLLGELFN